MFASVRGVASQVQQGGGSSSCIVARTAVRRCPHGPIAAAARLASGQRSVSMMPGVSTFDGDFTQPSVIPESANARVLELMKTGRLFRYSAKDADDSDAALAEKAVADYIGQKYCIGEFCQVSP